MMTMIVFILSRVFIRHENIMSKYILDKDLFIIISSSQTYQRLLRKNIHSNYEGWFGVVRCCIQS